MIKGFCFEGEGMNFWRALSGSNRVDPSRISITRCTKFLSMLYVEGSIAGPKIRSVRAPGAVGVTTKVQGTNFSIQALYPADVSLSVMLEMTLANGADVAFSPLNGQVKNAGQDLHARFIQGIQALDRPKLIDIGGRSRSQIDRSKQFPNADVTVVDVLPGENVTVVGDAHQLSDLFAPETFDAAYSVAVFEHLFMPWRVALEMNAVMKPGALGYVLTHQTLGMHDMPWDFWRYSDTAWDAIFNEYTGFEVVDRQLFDLSYILPFHLSPGKIDAEKAAGFEGSAVLFRKIGPSKVRWDVPMSIIKTIYPA